MTTVLLTPTHIASDHTILEKTYTHITRVDKDYKKIFIPEHRKFALGTCGSYHPKDLDKESTYSLLEKMIKELTINVNLTGDSTYTFKESFYATHLLDLLDLTTQHFLVTRNYRFVIHYSIEKAVMKGTVCSGHVGLGSGGNMGVGLLLGGRTIHNVWTDLNQLDDMTSLEHTVVALSSLKPWRGL